MGHKPFYDLFLSGLIQVINVLLSLGHLYGDKLLEDHLLFYRRLELSVNQIDPVKFTFLIKADEVAGYALDQIVGMTVLTSINSLVVCIRLFLR